MRERLGLGELVAEPGFTAAERVAARPTLEVNGIWGGFQGKGSKTVIPNDAHANLTCRLVPDQDPKQVVAAIEAHVAANTPPAVEVEIARLEGGARPYKVPADHPSNRAVAAVLEELYGEPPV